MKFLLKLISLLTLTLVFINTATANPVEYTWSFSDQVNGFTASADMFWDDTANSLISSSFQINGTNHTTTFSSADLSSDSYRYFYLAGDSFPWVTLSVSMQYLSSGVSTGLGSIFSEHGYNFGSFGFSIIDYSTFIDGVAYIPGLTRVEVSTVPEPNEYAMLLAGLGLVGLAARRKKVANA